MNDFESPEPEGLSAAFSAATALRELGGGDSATHLHPDWVVGGKPHGGYLLALLARAGCAGTELPPVAISANYLRVAQIGPVLLRTETLKEGRTVTVRRVTPRTEATSSSVKPAKYRSSTTRPWRGLIAESRSSASSSKSSSSSLCGAGTSSTSRGMFPAAPPRLLARRARA